ncbi:hypothetical protein KR026_010682 [Drosophila bipectinata]|nr:hypothetical protein KR026_010682 [Drosophila bipectinata]
MHLIKVAFLLSFVALCLQPQVDAALSYRTDRYLRCLEVVADAGAIMIENSVTALKTLAECVDFEPQIKLTGSVLRFIKLAHEFLKRAIFDKQVCLIRTATTAVNLVRPLVAKFDSLKCFED